jgi:LysM repeat protein
MLKVNFSLILIFLGQLLFSQKILREEYILLYKDIAIEEMQRTGVPASITLSQGILESGSGNSRLAKEANNHFGIKCHKNWTGRKITHDDDHKGECFRAYDNAEESFRDHSDFLSQGSRYAFLFELSPSDYKGWCRGLKAAGYATEKNYDNMLIRIIEENQLYLFDQDVKVQPRIAQQTTTTQIIKDVKPTKPIVKTPESTEIDLYGVKGGQINRIDYVIAQKNDTWRSLTKKHNKMPWELYKYNDISREMSAEIKQGQVIFLQPKRRKADRDFRYHTVTEGETMWSISQKYGIRLNRLYKLNRMEADEEPEVGQKMYLRKRKPENS